MTRAQRVAVISTVFISLYLLAFFEILQVPLVDGTVVQEILPVVSIAFFNSISKQKPFF